MTLRWHAPADNGSPIVTYVLERDDGQGGEYHLVYAGPRLTATAQQLRNGLQYRFRLRADNDVGLKGGREGGCRYCVQSVEAGGGPWRCVS